MKIVIALIALPVVIVLGAIHIRSKGDSVLRDFALIGTIALIVMLYYS